MDKSRPILLYFTTNSKGDDPRKPSKAFQACRSVDNIIFNQFADTKCGISIKHFFKDNCYKIEVDESAGIKGMDINCVPCFVVLDSEGKIVGQQGGKGNKRMAAGKLYGMFVSAAKKGWNFKLKPKVSDTLELLGEILHAKSMITAKESMVKSQRDAKKKEKYQAEVDKFKAELDALWNKRDEIWDMSEAFNS